MSGFRFCFALLCLAAAGCRSAPPGSERIDPALATLIPSGTVMLAGARMEVLRATPTWKKWIAGKPVPALDRFAAETGIDLRQDIWEVLLASNGQESVVMARGKFSGTSGEEPRINRPGITRTPYKGYTLIGNDEGAVAFMNSSSAVAGRPAAVRAVIDQRDRPAGAAPLLNLVRTISGQNQVWAVSIGSFAQLRNSVPSSGNFANLGKILSMIDNFVFAADLRTGLKANATALCKTDQGARSLSDALRGLIGFGRLSTPDNHPEMLRVYDAMKVEQKQRTVEFSADLPQTLLDTLIGRTGFLNTPGPPASGRR